MTSYVARFVTAGKRALRMNKDRIRVIAGPTAAGKSALAVEAALEMGAEIISADACQIYRGLPILTAQPEPVQLAAVPHHLVGMVSPTQEFSAADFTRLAREAIVEIQQKGRVALIVGGSGFYLGAVFGETAVAPLPAEGLREELGALSLQELLKQLAKVDPVAAAQVDAKNPRRVQRALEVVLTTGKPFQTFAPRKPAMPDGLILYLGRDELRRRIELRTESMLANGAIEEVAALGEISSTCAQIIGLQDIRDLLAGRIDRAECRQRLVGATWQYARRQMTWFRNQPPWSLLNLADAQRQMRAVS